MLAGSQLAPTEIYDPNAGDFVLLRFGEVLDAPEQCDDGNADGEDCCAIDCRPAAAERPCQDAAGDLCSEGRCDGAGSC